ncbi:MAG: Ig-like domain-containing protein [Gammaproteobacteria bacterium]
MFVTPAMLKFPILTTVSRCAVVGLAVLSLASCGGGSAGSDANQKPLAVNDSAVTTQGAAVIINVISNDSDADGSIVANSISISLGPSNGHVNVNSDGSVTYSPNASFQGSSDSFKYTVNDDKGATSNVATVTVSFQSNTAPVAQNDNVLAHATVPTIIDVLSNDSDSDGSLDAGSVAIGSDPGNGTAIVNNDGTVAYTSNAGYTGSSDSFTYTVKDNDGAVSNIATVSITLNYPPDANNDSAQTNQGSAVIINILQNDTDPELQLDASSVAIGTAPTNGSAVANVDGTVTYTPNGGFTGPTDSFSYTVSDNHGVASNVATVTVSINARPVANNDSAQTNQGSAVIINILQNDSDPDGTLQANSVVIISPATNGNAVNNNDGTVTYTPSGGFTGPTDFFSYTVADNQGAVSNVANVTVSVNARPVANNDNVQTNQGSAVIINILQNDNDLDGTLQTNSVVIISQPTNGNIVDNNDGTVTYTPNGGFTGPSDSFTYTVSDDQGATSNIATVTILVNQIPQASNFCGNTPQEQFYTGTLPATDPDNSPGGLVYSLGANGVDGNGPVFTAKGKFEITNNLTGAFKYTPNAHPSRRGSDTIIYHVEDTVGGAADATVTVIINPRIMPLGDSITQGIVDNLAPPHSTRIGYREKLQNDLTANGYGFDFVGARSMGSGAGIDPDNNGYAGARSDEIDTGTGTDDEILTVNIPSIDTMLANNPPDIILLHLGTNDIIQLSPNDPPITSVESILTKINAWETSANGNPVAVVLARIIDQCVNFPTDCGTGETRVSTFNNSVVTMAQGKNAGNGPDELNIVNQFGALLNGSNVPDIALYGNQYHPNASGYNKMATRWFNSLTNPTTAPAILTKCP